MQKVMMLKHKVWLGLLCFFQQCMRWLAALNKHGMTKTQINFDAVCRPVQAISSRHTAIYFVSLALSVFTAFGLLIASDRAEAATATYTSSTTWTAPAGATTVTAEVWGGGGGGGGQGATTTDGGGGGGGGAYSKQTAISVSGGTGYSVTVGTGGAGGVGVATASSTTTTSVCGGAGGDSWFSSTSTVLAKGGSAGCNALSGTPTAGGAGGAAGSGVGATKFSGGTGGQGRNASTAAGGAGGSSAGTAANGTTGTTATGSTTVTGAVAPAGGGNGGNGGASNADGAAPASGNGGGGGGSGDDSSGGSNRTGGSGANGKVVITYVALSDAYISISGATGTGGAFKIGDTVTATWNNTATGDNNANTISSVTVNFSQFGGGTAVAATNSSGTWTASYIIVADSIDNTNRNISVTATDSAGNSSTTTDSSNATVDNIAPTVTDANISISGATGTGGAFKIGDTVTATWNNTAAGDNNADTISAVTVDFSQFGGGSAVAATNASGTWTAIYTIVAGTIDATNRNITVTATDNAGNTKATADTTGAIVDNIAPTVTDARISISGATGASGVYKTGDTVTATWNNTAAGDNNTDTISAVTVDFSQFGGGSAVAATNASGTWTATYIIVAGTINNTSNRNVSVTATDNAGNTGTTADTTNATVDNQAPTVSSVAITSATGILNSTLNAGDIVNVTVTMNEASTVTGTPQLTLNIGGTLVQANYASGSGSTALVFSYTILAGQTDTNGISINANSLSGTIKDAAGNPATLSHTAVADNSSYKVDTTAPASATATSGVSGNAKVTLNWTTSSATDFNTTSGSVVYRWTSASAGSEVPASDSTPTVGSTNGTATVACVVSSAASTALTRVNGTGGSSDCATAALTTGQTYTYKVFQKDLAGNYDAGVTIGSLTLNTTTIADGANPGNSTVAPGSAITDLDSFTLQTSAGTDTVTAVTVTLAPTGAFNNIAQVDLTDNSNTALCTAVTNPASNAISFSTCTVPVSATATTYKVRVTPKTHANMPAPPGASYATTGTVTAFTGTNATSGTDTASATITIDNASPTSATATSGVSGNAKVTLNWTTSSATDFNTTSGSVVYRWASTTAGSEVPAEGSTPTVGSTNGTATVACVVSSAASTALNRIDGTGGSSDCTTTALTTGQTYAYKVFQKDANGNYDTGATIGSLTLKATTIADGTNPGNSSVAPGSAITDLDSFTLQTSAGTDTVTAVTVTLAPTGAFNNIAQVDLTDNSNVARCTAVTNPTSNTISFSTCASNGGIPVTTTATTFKVRITPKTHANMPVPPGASYATTGTVTAFTGTNASSGTDTASATITIDNASPVSATATSGVSDNTKVTLNWTTSSDTDFNATSGSVVYRWASATAGTEVPAEGSTPTLGSTNGTATVACVVSSAASTSLTRINGTGGSSDCTTTALTNGQAYTYKVFQKDTNGNYDVGVTIGSVTPAVVNCTSQATGNWNSASTWTQCRSGIPLAGDSATIASTHNVTLNVNTPSLVSLTINSGGTLTNTGSNTITLTSDMNNAGIYSGGSGAVSVAGNFSNTGTFTSGSATWTFSGSSAQSITGVTSFTNLTINNANGVTLNNNVTVTTALTLTSGSVSTGSNIIGVTANCPGGVSRTSGFVDGNLQLKFPSGTTTCTYYVGSGTTYAPISLTLTASASGTALTGSTTGNEHPSIATSGVDATKDVNRYWSLWKTGDTATAVTSFNATFTFVSGDVDIGAATGSFIVGKYDGSSWTLPTIGTRTSTTTSISNVSGAITANLGFVAGEAGVVDAPCTSPAGMTCVCDNFARSSLNPSTIFGANWVVGHSNGTFGDPVIVSNSLRLTDATTNVATVATLPGQFPAAGNKITVEFQHYAYGSTAYTTTSPCSASSPCGADGIALTLSDSTITPVAGAYGGSLGYAQKTGINGFAGGWLGVGIDEWGNFATGQEGRVGGGSSLVPESVTLRGSGSGSGTGSSNYPYLVSTGTLSPFIDNALSSTRSRGYSYRITVDASAYTWNGSTGVKTTNVKVERDTGSGYTTLPNLDLPDIYTYNTGQANVPENWKLSFTGGTGSATNIHEIRGLKICSTSYTPPSGFSILVDNLSPTTCTTATNGKPVITISARNSYGNVITSYTNTVTLNAKVSSPSGSNSTTAVWSKVSGSANGTLSGNQYTFASADNGVAQFYLTDTSAEDIYITVGENGGTLSTTLGTPLQFRGTAFTVSIPDTLGDGVVAGRNHLMRITRSSGCGVDTTYSGAKNLDGWYSIATGTHPSGAYAPQFCLTNVGGTCLPDTGSCETLSIAAPTLNASSNYLPALTFSSGVANFCLKTTDVGNYSVNLRDDSNVSVPITGSSATLAVRPFAIVASNVSQGTVNNPATGDATGTPMVAGTAFQTMVAGYLWNSAGDIANNGLPSSSAGYTALTAAGTLHSYADTVVLSASTPFAPTTPSDTPVGIGVAGSLTNGSVALTGGAATLSNLSYNEVGSFTLKAQPSINYLNAGIDLTSRVAYFTNPLSSSSTAWVGRFRPDHFTLSPGTTTPGCGTFTYFGQDGFSSTAFLLTAQNANNYTTQNYAGAYAKLDLTSWANFYFSVSSLPSGSALSVSATAPTGTWNNGVATVTAKHQVSRPAALTGQTNITVKAAPVDSDGVTMAIADVGPATPLRYGRLSLQNAYGSELLDLPMAFVAEYWNGNGWVSNTADQCTTGVSLSVADPIATDGLVPAELFVWDTGSGSGNSGLGYSVAGTNVNKFSEPPNQGSFNLNFRAPGSGNTGALDITAAVPDYLKFNWKGAGNENPTARATFGIYKGNSRFIYIRELY